MVQIIADKKGNYMKFIENQINRSIQKIELLDALKKMRNDLLNLGPVPLDGAIYDYGVNFFNITTTFYDNYNIDIKQIKSTEEDAKNIVRYITITGHRFNNWVRAPKGTPVTLDNLYISDPAQKIMFKPALYFKNSSDAQSQKIAQKILLEFILSYREPMIASLTRIVKFNKKPNNFIIRHALKKRNQITH